MIFQGHRLQTWFYHLSSSERCIIRISGATIFLSHLCNQLCLLNSPIITILTPVSPDIVLEILGPSLCSWIICQEHPDDVLNLTLVIICMPQNMASICKIGQSYLISAQKLCLIFFKSLLYLLQPIWQL